jgi:guanosine-3',5'-bis(diphosphate) 3'-pyrophosphohydrolase
MMGRGFAAPGIRIARSGAILRSPGPEAIISDVAQLLQAIEFSASKHPTQRRKDADASPYINHVIAVATLLATTGEVTDLPVLIAAVLHDTLEDTETTPAELQERFGAEVTALVEEMTDDKSQNRVGSLATPHPYGPNNQSSE